MKTCQNCHAQVEDDARFCDSCGAQIPEEISENIPEMIYCPHCGSQTVADSAFCASCGKPVVETIFCENCGQKAEGPGNICQNCGTQLYEQIYCPNCGTASVSDAVFCKKCGSPLKEDTASNKKKERKPGRVVKTVLLVAVPVLALVVLAGVFFPSLAHFARKTFSSPESYFEYVMKKSVKENAGTTANFYNNLIKENMNYTDRSGEIAVTVKLGEDVRDLLEDARVLDETEWLEKVQFRIGSSVKDEIISANAALQIGEEEVLSGNAAFNTSKGELYAQVPVLSDKYIGMNLEDFYDSEEFAEVLEQLSDIYEAYPDKDAVERLMNKYAALAISCIDEVEKGKDVVDAGGVSQKCTTLQVNIRSKTLRSMAETVLKEMRQDEELKTMMKKLSRIEGLGDTDSLYDDFRDAIDYALDDLDDIEIDGRIVVDVYVNNKGELIGAQMKYDGAKLFFARTKKGSSFGTEFSVNSDYVEMKLEGSGKQSGDKKSGEYTLKVDERYGESFKLGFRVEDFDEKAWKNGNINGTVILPLKGFEDIFDVNLSIFRRCDLRISFDIKQAEGKTELILTDDKEDIASVMIEFKSGAGKKVETPKGSEVVMVEDFDDLEDWLDTVDIDELIDKLEKADLPSELIDEIEDGYDDLMSYYSFTPPWGTSAPAAAEDWGSIPAPAEEEPVWEGSTADDWDWGY